MPLIYVYTHELVKGDHKSLLVRNPWAGEREGKRRGRLLRGHGTAKQEVQNKGDGAHFMNKAGLSGCPEGGEAALAAG